MNDSMALQIADRRIRDRLAEHETSRQMALANFILNNVRMAAELQDLVFTSERCDRDKTTLPQVKEYRREITRRILINFRREFGRELKLEETY